MEIVIDTNIIYGNWKLRGTDFDSFFNFIKVTKSIVYFPRIVWKEIIKNYKEEIINKHIKYKAGVEGFKSIVIDDEVSVVEIDLDAMVARYIEWLKNKLEFNNDENILPYGEYTIRTAKRIMAKRRPFTENNSEQYKDALIWETVLDILGGTLGRNDKEVVLISNDCSAFGADKVMPEIKGAKAVKQIDFLHPHLQEDVDAFMISDKRIKFSYYESIPNFLAAYSKRVDGIDNESIVSYLENSTSDFSNMLTRILRKDIWSSDGIISKFKLLNDFENIATDSSYLGKLTINSVKSFYISLNEGNSVIASGVVFVNWAMQVFGRPNEKLRIVGSIVHLPVEVKFNLNYTDGKPSSVDIESASITLVPEMVLYNSPVLTQDAFQSILSRYGSTVEILSA